MLLQTVGEKRETSIFSQQNVLIKVLGSNNVGNLLTQQSCIQCPRGHRTGRTGEQKQLHPTAHSVDPQAFSLSIICPHSVPSVTDSPPLLKNTFNRAINKKPTHAKHSDWYLTSCCKLNYLLSPHYSNRSHLLHSQWTSSSNKFSSLIRTASEQDSPGSIHNGNQATQFKCFNKRVKLC